MLLENRFGQLKDWRGEAICQEDSVLGDLPDTRLGDVDQSNLTTRSNRKRYQPAGRMGNAASVTLQ